VPRALRGLYQIVDLPPVPLNHCVQLVLPAAFEQVSLDLQYRTGPASKL